MSDIEEPKPSFIPAAALLERGVAETVVGCALLRIRKVLISLVEFLETRLRLLVAGVAVGMAAHRGLAERRLQLGFGGGLGDAQCFVKVAFGHLPPKSRANVGRWRPPLPHPKVRKLQIGGNSRKRKRLGRAAPVHGRFQSRPFRERRVDAAARREGAFPKVMGERLDPFQARI